MKLAVILYNGLACNSALHVISLCAAMGKADDEFVIAVPAPVTDDKPALPRRCRSLSHEQLVAVVDSGEWVPELVVAWTPRENVRPTALRISKAAKCPYAVHLEDNEDAITARHMGRSYESLLLTPPWKFRHLNGLPISCPWRSRRFLRGAAAVSTLMDRLTERIPHGVPTRTFWPGYDEALFGRIGDLATTTRPAESIPGDTKPTSGATIVYTGNIHRGNVADMQALYTMIALLNDEGFPTRLLRTGETHVPGFSEHVAPSVPYVTELGVVPREQLPGLLASADVLVQPGKPGAFNDYRFPSKLPEFLVSGKPVVMARSNIGRFLKDGKEALIVDQGTPREMADAVKRLLVDPALAKRVGSGGKAFAERALRWRIAAATAGALWRETSRRHA